jgi:hypothetical protein
MTYVRKLLLVVLIGGTAANVWYWSDRFMNGVVGISKTEEGYAARLQRNEGVFTLLHAVRVEALLVAAVAIFWVLLPASRRQSPADSDRSG